ncbi:hypothetical protein FDUTEX481_03952 [Tolypothrix sp. PCC 7601]|nr:hypothetical protein FDUTEX481_03952 [Tolypothrix sp. PCC 7601]
MEKAIAKMICDRFSSHLCKCRTSSQDLLKANHFSSTWSLSPISN